jgi:hypothetical protein
VAEPIEGNADFISSLNQKLQTACERYRQALLSGFESEPTPLDMDTTFTTQFTN